MQTILGAGGAIGVDLARTLPQFTDRIRLVSRNPKPVNENDELFPINILNYAEIEKAVSGSEIVYLVVGINYTIREWKQHWVNIMKHTIDACLKHNSKLVFFDNVYSYGLVKGWMTEETPFNPCSVKGEIRAEVATLLLNEMKRGSMQAIIARGADFYGPHNTKSALMITVFDRLKKKQAAQWMGDVNAKHSFTYTPDAGKATAILGNTPDAYNQTWHVPTDMNVLTGKQIIEKVAAIYGVKPKYMAMPRWMVKASGIFIPILREFPEMMYQNEHDYLFSSTKFQNRFFKATPYDEGIRLAIAG
ncbi:MAG: NAD-dependent epimerase/dehydratase family protein [Chitinophagales bacterium]|nr:NAD-dependent epimerase/dehydratase family protein [Bacteroidota bacterium]MBX7141206.1 NAD-dependent epimerase/dehydratase family protein [Chitinophagales bacterium]